MFTQLRWHWRNNDRVRAIGEFGLDYERLQYCAVDVQKKWFEAQLIAAASEAPDLPLFLHQRGAASDFYHIIRRNRSGFKAGVMHSFTGTIEEAHEAIGLGLYVGINGCSLRTDLGLRVVENIPLESMMVESDAPWCEIRPSSPAYSKFAYNTTQLSKERYSTELDAFNLTNLSNNNQEDFDPSVDESTSQTSHDLPSINCDYSSYEYFEKTIKGRCEPLMTRKVLEVIASVKGLPLTTVAEVIYGNSVRVFKI